MKIMNGKEYYTITEISQLLKINTNVIYYRINNQENFTKPLVENGVNYFSQDQIHEIKKYLRIELKKGRIRQTKYIPKQNNSYSKLKQENLELAKEISELKEKLKEA